MEDFHGDLAKAFAEGLINAIPICVAKVPLGVEVLHLWCDVKVGYDWVMHCLTRLAGRVGVTHDMGVEDVG